MRVEVIKGDITKFSVDAIVNAANFSLMGGGGVDGTIHRAGGPAILEECKKIVAQQGGCKTGEAVITTGGNLPSRYVIHTVGPVWQGGGNSEERNLANCYSNSLQLAVNHKLKSIAFPNISTGIYGFAKDKAARIAVHAINEFLASHPTLEKVVLVCFDDENFSLVNKSLESTKR